NKRKMATEEDLKKAEDTSTEEDASPAEPEEGGNALVRATGADAGEPAKEEALTTTEETDEGVPVQLGYQRYVYAAYMAGAMIVGFLAAKIGHTAWYRLGQWKPELGEPKDELLYPVATLIGILVALYYWRKAEARQYANEVAEELSKVTWPSRKEVTNSTTV